MKHPFLVSVVCCATLALAPKPRAEEPDPAKLLGVVQSYLSVVDRMGQVAADPRAALMLAQNSIKEAYEQKGRKAEAAPELRKMTEDKETGQKDRAPEELRLIVSANKALLARRR
ncbi:MAG: hypothetical protein AB7O37_04930 [Vicinamibacteria bacterium]